MDKFGIFNLLNSFFSLGKSENEKTNDTPTSTNDLLSNLFSSITNSKKPENKNEKTVSAPPMPLQNSMLSTINSHDQIVKRVKKKQRQP